MKKAIGIVKTAGFCALLLSEYVSCMTYRNVRELKPTEDEDVAKPGVQTFVKQIEELWSKYGNYQTIGAGAVVDDRKDDSWKHSKNGVNRYLDAAKLMVLRAMCDNELKGPLGPGKLLLADISKCEPNANPDMRNAGVQDFTRNLDIAATFLMQDMKRYPRYNDFFHNNPDWKDSKEKANALLQMEQADIEQEFSAVLDRPLIW
jgi:hypothetical protein